MPAISESVAVDHPTSHGVEENRMSVTGSAGPKDDSPDMGGSSERKVVWSVQDEGTVSMVESAAPSEGGNHTPSQLPLLKRKVSRGNSMNGRHPHIVDGEVVSVPIIIKDRLQKKLGFDNNQLEYMMKIRSIFDDIDYDALGFLTWPNLIRGFERVLDIYLSKDECHGFFEKYDLGQAGVLQYREFEEMVKEMVPPTEQDAGDLKLEYRLKEFFAENDLDNNGLSKEEIMIGLDNMGMELTIQQLERIFELADTNGDGVLDFREFSSLYLRHKAYDDHTAQEIEQQEARWRTKEVVVGDGHPWTRVGQKVMVRPSLKHQRGFQRMCGIGQLVRPEKSFGGRWYVKFPCTPEVLLSTGRHGNHELMFVLDLLNHEMNDAETRVHERLWMEQDNVFLEQAQQFASIAPRSRRGIDEEDEEEANDLASAPSVSSVDSFNTDLHEFRQRLIFARMQADPMMVDPKKKDTGSKR